MSRVLFEQVVRSVDELDSFVSRLEGYFKPRTVVLLEGEVGSGKTETVKALARRRGWTEIASPSFALHHRYGDEGDGADHLDLYRLESEDDLETTGFWDLFSEERGLILIEWADRLNPAYLPADWFKIRVRYSSGDRAGERRIVVESVDGEKA